MWDHAFSLNSNERHLYKLKSVHNRMRMPAVFAEGLYEHLCINKLY